MEKIKGAFKDFPIDKQPIRIPLEKIKPIEDVLLYLFSDIGDLHFIDISKKTQKETTDDITCSFFKKTTGDIDVLFVPKIKNWREEICKSEFVVAHLGNSAQLMTVMHNLIGDRQKYMVDFLVVKKDGLAFKKLFYSHGTAFSAPLGSFARSIGYKFTDYALYKRMKDKKGNWHNVLLTTDPDIALKILGLDSNINQITDIHLPEGIACWLTQSPRFDINLWKNGNPDKIAVGVPINKNAREAIKKDERTRKAYGLVNASEKNAIPCGYMEYEEKLLGEEKVKSIEEEINKLTAKSDNILNGKEIMEILHIPPGPKIGEIQKYITTHFSKSLKEQAICLIKLLNNI